jgi:signal transduction histidine kinase
MLNQAIILLFIISFLDLALGLFVFLKNPKEKMHRSFFFLSLAILVWINASYFEDALTNPTHMYFLLQLDFASGIFASFALLLFCLDVSKTEIAVKPLISRWLMAIPLAFSVLVFATKLILSGYVIQQGTIVPVFGRAYLLYDVFVGVALLLGISALIWKYWAAAIEDKAKLIYLFIGFSLSSVIAFLTNVALIDYIENSPNLSLYSRLGSFSTVFIVLSSGYAIVKQRLFNFKIISTELLSLGILVFSLFQVLESHSLAELIGNSTAFIILIVFMMMLIRGIEKDTRRKEELQALSDKLAAANARLKELDKARAEFMSFASHQLQTPLTAIRGFASLLLEGSGGALTAAEKDMIGKIAVSSERMVHLVEDYLNLSRIESGKLEFTFAKCSLEDICQEVVDTLALKAKEKNLSLTFHRPNEPLPEVVIDGPKVREVISNLVDNAVKYTPAGSVTVDVERRRRKEGENSDWVKATVSDTGLGISKTELSHLFAKFDRGTNKERLMIKGTGLGLYVGKVMIENNGGKIWAESDGEGKGSRFIVEIPLKQSSELLKRGWGGSGAQSAG